MARPRGKRKEARLSVSLDDHDYAELCALARRNDVSIAWMVRQAIHTLIGREQEKAHNPELPLLRPAATPKRATS